MVPYEFSLSSTARRGSFLVITTTYVSITYDFGAEADVPRLIASGY
jgi:hypothetical protein